MGLFPISKHPLLCCRCSPWSLGRFLRGLLCLLAFAVGLLPAGLLLGSLGSSLHRGPTALVDIPLAPDVSDTIALVKAEISWIK